MEQSYGIIYQALNPTNGKRYIGQSTQSLEERKYQHKWEAERIQKGNNIRTPFYNAINKYGFDHFQWNVVIECSNKEQMDKREKHTIAYYKKHGGVYNVKSGGSQDHKKRIGRTHSPETIAKMTGQKRTPAQIQNMKDAWKNRKPLSEEMQAKVSARLKEVNTGKTLSEEHKVKIKKGVLKTLTPEINYKRGSFNRGKTLSDETKEKMSISNKKYLDEHPEAIQRGENATMYGRTGGNHPMSMSYLVTFPDGHQETIKGLLDFCRNNSISYDGFKRQRRITGNCEYKGWKIEKYKEE